METPHAPARTVTPAYDDFSGVDMSAFSNPYDALIAASKEDPVRLQHKTCVLGTPRLRPPQKEMQTRYSTHREARNAAQKEKLLAPDFAGVMVDPILLRLENPSIEPGFVDTRNCLVFWARPPEKVKALVKACQEKLKDVVPSMLHILSSTPSAASGSTRLVLFHADRCPRQTFGSCPRLLST